MIRLSHAVVIGGGMAGLLHARVLADYANRVTILDRDEMPEQIQPRAGVPQGKFIHYLMVRGLRILDEFFPGLHDELDSEAGVPKVQVGIQTRYMLYQRWQPLVDSGLYTFSIERPHLEGIVRRRLLERENIQVVERTEAVGLTFDGARVNGVITRKRPSDGQQQTVPADLVVDASGRGSKVLDWLESAGYPAPRIQTIDPRLGYASRWFAKPKTADDNWSIMYVLTSPPDQTRGAIMMRFRNSRWLGSLIGTNGDYPPASEAEFLEFARSLPDPTIYELFRSAKPLSDVISYRNTANRRYFYERLDRLPERLYITGDALCEVNPVYGQGMTKAARNAAVLRDELASGKLDNRSFYRQAAKGNAEFWNTAAGGDLNYPGTVSSTPESPVDRMARAYFGAVLRSTVRDARVTYAFHRVLNMVDPPTRLLTPAMMLRVLRAQGR